MRRTRFFLAGTLSLCLAVGVGLIGCGDDEGTTIEIDLAQLCAQSLQAMNSQGCIDTAYADVDDLKDCFVDCGPEAQECLEENCLDSSGPGFSECTGNVEFLFGGQCGVCYTNCGLDFAGVSFRSEPAPDRNRLSGRTVRLRRRLLTPSPHTAECIKMGKCPL